MDLNDKTDDEILLIANPVMDNLMDGATERDWAKHTLHFTDGAKASLTEAELLRQCEQYQSTHGVFKERVFYGYYQTSRLHQYCMETNDDKSQRGIYGVSDFGTERVRISGYQMLG